MSKCNESREKERAVWSQIKFVLDECSDPQLAYEVLAKVFIGLTYGLNECNAVNTRLQVLDIMDQCLSTLEKSQNEKS